ncbi:uncharacterized protein [Anabrus simplex]|uniref:uncharacterized protein n=1 Tax=Anabrus simplex TaxID=316456 RepID=UPI0035A28B7F
MDQKLEIKEEPVWLEGTANTSLENFEFVSEMISLKQETKSELTEPQPTQGNTFKEDFEHVSEITPLKQETKSELTEPVPTQENAFENATDIKHEIYIEDHTIDQMYPCFKEENGVKPVAVLTSPTGKRTHRCTACSMMFCKEFDLKKHMKVLTTFRNAVHANRSAVHITSSKLASESFLISGPVKIPFLILELLMPENR